MNTLNGPQSGLAENVDWTQFRFTYPVTAGVKVVRGALFPTPVRHAERFSRGPRGLTQGGGFLDGIRRHSEGVAA